VGRVSCAGRTSHPRSIHGNMLFQVGQKNFCRGKFNCPICRAATPSVGGQGGDSPVTGLEASILFVPIRDPLARSEVEPPSRAHAGKPSLRAALTTQANAEQRQHAYAYSFRCLIKPGRDCDLPCDYLPLAWKDWKAELEKEISAREGSALIIQTAQDASERFCQNSWESWSGMLWGMSVNTPCRSS
jgi:hypothetical protein